MIQKLHLSVGGDKPAMRHVQEAREPVQVERNFDPVGYSEGRNDIINFSSAKLTSESKKKQKEIFFAEKNVVFQVTA